MDRETAQRLKTARRAKKLTQDDVARALGLSQQAVSKMETAEGDASKHLLSLARLYGVSADWLETGHGPRTVLRYRELAHLESLDPEMRQEILSLISAVDTGAIDRDQALAMVRAILVPVKPKPPAP